MASCMVRIGSNGRFVIPAEYRKSLGVEEGDVLLLRVHEGELRVSTARVGVSRAQELVSRHVPEGHSLSNELLSERRNEAEREG